ncbi:MAG: hypothetical protein ACFCU1_03595 [Sumerlaeia bacterium]
MSETLDLLKQIEQRIIEKDEVIDEQMSQLAELETELNTLREQIAALTKQLESLAK